jgi:hypothetical protein
VSFLGCEFMVILKNPMQNQWWISWSVGKLAKLSRDLTLGISQVHAPPGARKSSNLLRPKAVKD